MSAANDRDERLADWLDGRLSPRDHERFEAELRVNPDLRRRADEYRRTVESVQRSLRAPMVKIDVADAVMQRIAEGGARPAPVASTTVVLRRASRRALFMSAAVAASVFALLALLFRWRPEPEVVPVAELAPGMASKKSEASKNSEELAEKDAPQFARRAGDDEAKRDIPAEGESEANKDRSVTTGSAGFPPSTTREMLDLRPDGEVRRLEAAQDPAAGRGLPTPPSAPTAVAPLPGTQPTPSPTLMDLDDLTRRAQSVEVGAAAPVVPITMLPQVRLQRAAADAARAVPQGQSSQETAILSFFARVDTDLATALPSGSLQIQRLARAPALVAAVTSTPDVSAGAASGAGAGVGELDAQAWLVEGPGPEVYHYLSMLSGAGRSMGFELVNGEVPANEVLTLLTAEAATNNLVAVEELAKEQHTSEGATSEGLVGLETKAKDKQSAPRVEVPADPTSKSRAGAKESARGGGSGGAVGRSRPFADTTANPPPTPTTPTPTPTPEPKPEGLAIGDLRQVLEPTRMRVVIVIDRAVPQKR